MVGALVFSRAVDRLSALSHNILRARATNAQVSSEWMTVLPTALRRNDADAWWNLITCAELQWSRALLSRASF
jgi:hypothetical protein